MMNREAPSPPLDKGGPHPTLFESVTLIPLGEGILRSIATSVIPERISLAE